MLKSRCSKFGLRSLANVSSVVRRSPVFLAAMGAIVLAAAAQGRGNGSFDIARIFIEYNFSGNDLGFHVFLDGEDWKTLKIVNPKGRTIFNVEGKGGYKELGLTELFFEGAEPTLDEFPLEDLLKLFPEGKYKFIGETVDGVSLMSKATLTHAVPAGPSVCAEVEDHHETEVVISWEPVTGPADILPDEEIEIVGYQVIVETFQLTLPASSTSVTLPAEFVESLEDGEHEFEVLAIEAGGNQTITEGTFVIGEEEAEEGDVEDE